VTSLHALDPLKYSIEGLCRLLGVSKQAYFQRDDDVLMRKIAQEGFALAYVREIRKKDPGLGGEKLWRMYKRDFTGNKPMGRDRFEALMDRYGLKVRKRVRKPRTTDSAHGLPVYPNLIRDFVPTAPNQLWVSDITYIVIWLDATRYCFCYLSMILDAYTEEIVGWSVGPTLDTEYPLRSLETALERIKDIPKEQRTLIHHSDRGVQYASKRYVELLTQHGIRISMTEDGNPKENPQAERINNTMKNELLKDMRFSRIDEVLAAVAHAVDFYNNERPHMSIDMMTPSMAAFCEGKIKKHWTSYREKAIREKQALEIPENSLPLPVVQGSPSGLRPSVNP
jgi:transposase InsO family protein